MKVRCTYRLRLSRTAERALLEEAQRTHSIWNTCVARAKELEADGYEAGPAGLQLELTDWRNDDSNRCRWLHAGSQNAQQQKIRDWGKSRAKAQKDLREDVPYHRRAGFPKFKAWDRSLPSMNYTTRGFKIADGRLVLAGGISVVVVWSRDLPSAPSSVRVSRDATGKWWASFVGEVEASDNQAVNEMIGVDWGLTDIANTTDPAFDMPNQRRGRKSATRLAESQREMARRRPKKGQQPSKRYAAAKHRTACLYQKVAWQRQDDSHQWAHRVAKHHQDIAIEDFSPKFMAKNRSLAKATHDAAIGQARKAIEWQVIKQGRTLHTVPAAHTTMDCSNCGVRAKRLPLKQRTFECSACGYVAGRDSNAANNMLVRAGLAPLGAFPAGDDREPACPAA